MIFEKGEYIVCNNVGICLVEDVTPKDMDGVMQEKLYYILQPLDSVDSRIYSAVDNEKMAMRRVISNEEVENLLDEMKEIEILSVDNEKRREEIYKETLHKCECIGWAQLIKTIYCRKKEKASQGKKITTTDSKYLKKAEDYLYHELAISLNLEPIDIKERVLGEIGIEEA
ncbi:MAG: CarD family transcriptional regulator [Cellulosilyticum sp.]|nr:CarD family transcriptional regulator [Cellulosilyticum sp.]